MFKKIILCLISVFLAAVMLTQTPAMIFAESKPVYLKELRMATAATKSEAVSSLENDGYTVVDCNLNEGSGNYCYLGYKTTYNAEEAISDLRLMNANGGISEMKYRDIMVSWKQGITTSAQYLKETCLEVKANYEKGSPLAKAAVELLDVFEADGVKLSDYLFDTGRTDEEYQDILLICADNVVSTIYSILTLGTADYETENFAERLSKTDDSIFNYDYITAHKTDELYSSYWTEAKRIIAQLQTFNGEYDDAVDYFIEYKKNHPDDSSEASLPQNPTEEEMNAYWKQLVNEKYKDGTTDTSDDLYKYAMVMGLYEKLASYPSFRDTYENLADYIYSCGDPWDDDGNEDTDYMIYRIYPLVASLTPGQMFTLQYGGVKSLLSSLDSNETTYYNQACAAVEAIKKNVKENGCERASIFYNVNRDIYNCNVAFTDKATREATASNTYDQLTRVEPTDQVQKNITNVFLVCGMVAGSILAVSVLYLGIAAAVLSTTSIGLLTAGFTAMLYSSVALAASEMALTSAAVITGVIGAATVIVVIILVAILIICVIIAIIKSLFEDDEEEDPEYPDMPDMLYDVVSNQYTEYRAVSDKDGNPVDINCGNGEQWDGLYYTYSSNIDGHIRADGGAFIFSTDSYVVPTGYTAVRRFGLYSTANLNSYKEDQKKPLYLFYVTDGTEKTVSGEYLYDITILSGKTADEARLGLVDKNYNVIEQNLTPCTGEVTYLGYKTTPSADEAITDIRIAYYYDASKVVFGTCYDQNGNLANTEYTFVGKLVTEASIFYTKQSSNGSPILADIRITEEQLDADSGYEPVNLFSGGSAFNLIIGSNDNDGIRVTKEGNWNKTLYMYFKPSEVFDSSGTEYISGFAFSSGYKDNLSFAAECGFKPVEELEGFNLTTGPYSDNPTYLLYSTTYNPYRAITEIRTYTAQNSSTALFENMVFGLTGYVACETFVCTEYLDFGGYDYYRFLRPSNAYLTRNSYEGITDYYIESEYYAVNNLGKYEEMPTKGLYVAGPSVNGTPLTVHDINYCTDADTTGRTAFVNDLGETVWCRPVNDLTECYSTVADNLTFEWNYYSSGGYDMERYYAKEITFENYLRIFYRGSVATRGKYVSNIYIATVDPEEDSESYAADQAISQLLSMGEGEIFMVNLSRSKSNQPYSLEKVTDGDSYYYREIYKSSSGKASYMLVQYTDRRLDSIRTAVTKWYDSDKATPSNTISTQGTDFSLAGSRINGLSGYYAIYTSKNGVLGSVTTDVILDSEYLVNGCTTVSDVDGAIHTGEDYIIKLRHGTEDESNLYYTKLVFASGKTKQAALTELYKAGCDGYIDHNKYDGVSSKYGYIGYKSTTDETDSVITGIKIILRSDSNAESTVTDGNITYTRVSTDMNSGAGGDYSYLYVTYSDELEPIYSLSTSTLMTSSLSKTKTYKSHDWTVTDDASNNSKAKTFKLCYRQRSSDWLITDDGVLYLSINGAMKNYSDKISFRYVKSGAIGGMLSSTTYYPDWCEYGESITEVSVGSSVTSIDDCAFRNCTNIETVTVFNKNCTIEDGAIPSGVKIKGYYGSTAYTYATDNGLEFEELGFVVPGASDGKGFVLGGTTVNGGTAVLVISIGAIIIASGAAALVIKKKKGRKKVGNEEKN